MPHVPHKGSAQAIADVVGEQTAMSFEYIVVARPLVKTGRIQAFGVISGWRASALPPVTTLTESGVPGFEAADWYGMVAPAATPRDISRKLNTELVRGLALPDVKERTSSSLPKSCPPRQQVWINSITRKSRCGRKW